MAYFPSHKVVPIIIIIVTFVITLLMLSTRSSSSSDHLSPNFYKQSCPNLLPIVQHLVNEIVDNEQRMGASLLRLHFHDCFVNGCDGSILLNDTSSFTGEKNAVPNKKSVRGFEVIDKIKIAVERICSKTVSCADIVAIAARDSVVRLGGPDYEVQLGRLDSKTANMADANVNLPSPFSNLSVLISNFKSKGLSVTDLVALSGAHTVGKARCFNFRKRLFNDKSMNITLAQKLKKSCSSSNNTDNNFAHLDAHTPNTFDNGYYAGLVAKEGLLVSDQQLHNDVEGQAIWQVRKYSSDERAFFHDFRNGMINMGRISTLTGNKGEIRKQCWKVNDHK